MNMIQGKKFLTVFATANEVYCIDYGTTPTLNILNLTDDDILIGVQSTFPSNPDQTAGQYLTLPSGNAANMVAFPVSKVYIEAVADGNVVIERS